MTDLLGEQIGNYRLIRYLGRGGFAEVYLGEHIHIHTFAAIKMLRTQLTKDEVDKFRNEAYLLAHLDHPHIVRVFDFGLQGDTPFLIMDYAPNGTLRQHHPRNTQLPIAKVIEYVKQLGAALQYAHNQKLVHRDIKPENMLVGRNNEVLLSDFGIATVAQSSQIQNPQIIAGTATYMAPEQIQGHARAASDQYALGVVVYEWLLGVPPFQGTFPEIATQHISTSPPPLRWKIPTISREIEMVVLTALQKDPDRRFGNIQAFANALEQASRLQPPPPPPIKMPAATTQLQPIRSASPGSPPAPMPVIHTPPAQPATAPVMTPGGTPPAPSAEPASFVPALPSPGVSTLWWPTFFLSAAERKAISNGILPQIRLDTPATVLTQLPAPIPLPMTTISSPLVKGSLANIQDPIREPARAQAGPSTQPTGTQVSSGGPIRTSRTPSSGPITSAGQPAAASRQGVVRSTGGPGTTSLPSSQPARTPVRLAAASLILACVSAVSLVIGFIVLNVSTVYYQESLDTRNAFTNLAPTTIIIAALLGIILGIRALQNSGITSKVKAMAGTSIALAVLATLVEIVLLATHVMV